MSRHRVRTQANSIEPPVDHTLHPQRRLAAALLYDAIGCYQAHVGATDPAGQRRFAEVEAWIHSRDSSYVFSFEGVCDILGLDPSFVRLGLQRWCARAACSTQTRPHAQVLRGGR